jgi:hypothetical protein
MNFDVDRFTEDEVIRQGENTADPENDSPETDGIDRLSLL